MYLYRDVQLYGPLDNSSAFLFESYLGHLKRVVRRCGRLPLKQAVNRLSDGKKRTRKVKKPKEPVITKKPPNNVYLVNGHAVEVIDDVIVDGQMLYECRKYHGNNSFFTNPIDSRILSCFLLDDDTSIVRLEPKDLTQKGFKISVNNNVLFMGLLHVSSEYGVHN